MWSTLEKSVKGEQLNATVFSITQFFSWKGEVFFHHISRSEQFPSYNINCPFKYTFNLLTAFKFVLPTDHSEF